MNSYLNSLYELAHLFDIQVAYNDIEHHRRQATVEALIATLQALGAPILKLDDIPSAIRERRQALWQNYTDPVLVTQNGHLAPIKLRLPSSMVDTPVDITVSLEDGDQAYWHFQSKDLPTIEKADVNGMIYVTKRIRIPMKLPLGYHQLIMELNNRLVQACIISAPRNAYSDIDKSNSRYWGVFVPLYALHTKESWGGGNLSDLEAMAVWVSGLGGKVVATLPLLATFFENTCDIGPYSPASRLFWNEAYIDIEKVRGFESCDAARKILISDVFHEELERLKKSPVVDYRMQIDVRRRILEQLSRCCFTGNPSQLEKCRDFVKTKPMTEDYARFRATCEKRHAHWHSWASPQKEGVLCQDDYDEETKRYHVYVQWLANEQLKRISQKAGEKDVKLYFDLPLGVHPDSYDVWRQREAFVLGVSAGAPPDSFFTKGQKWGLTPLSPDGIRKQGYKYYIAYLRHNLQYADILRIDHVMAYHRLYVIPHGFDASHGVYIRYHPSEFYAIVNLESYRNKAIILGEDLGTVPADVRTKMVRHDLYRHYVIQYEMSPTEGMPFSAVPEKVVASINTHDMPTFAGFWQGDDIQQQYELGLLDKDDVKKEHVKRQHLRRIVIRFLKRERFVTESSPGIREILKGILAFLSSSKAQIMLVNLEDLWLEKKPQNVPGTSEKNRNYCRKLFYPFEKLSQLPEVLDILSEVNQRRKGAIWRKNNRRRQLTNTGQKQKLT